MLLFGCHSRFAQWIYHIGSVKSCFSVFHGTIGSTIRFMHNRNQPNLQFLIEQSTLISSVSPQYESKILKKIRATKSTEEILLLVSLQEKMLPSEISASLYTLVQHKYSSLSSACWSYYNSQNEIWIQANINRDIKSTFLPLLNSPDFHKLCNHLATLCPQLSNIELLTCLHSLLCLHFPADDWLSVKLQQHCLQKSYQFDLSELALYSSIPKMLQRNGITISSRVCTHFQEIITNDELNTENFHHIARVLYNSGYFLSSRFIEAIMAKMSNFVKDEDNEIDAVLLIYCVEAFVRYSNSTNSNILEHFLHRLCKAIQNMGINDLRKLVAALDISGYLNDDLKMLFKMRALARLSEGFLYSTDVVSLINIFDACGWTDSTAKEMEGLVLLHVHELEALALKHLSSSKFMVMCQNCIILNEFSERVSRKLGDISTSLSCLISIVKFYTRVYYRNENFHFRLRNLLLQQIHIKQKIFHPSHLRVLYEYFLSTSKRVVHVPSVILNGVASLIHQFTFNDTTSISRTLNKLNFQQMSVLEKLTVQELRNALRNNAFQRQNEVHDLKQLILLYKSSLVDHHEENDMIILASLYEKVIPTVTLETLRICCAQLSKLTLHAPKAFHYLCDFAFRRREQLELDSLLCLLETCAVINFLPENIHELQEHFVSRFRSVNSRLSDVDYILMSSLIRFAHSGALMGHFPKPLKLVFTVEFIRMLEEQCVDESLLQKLLELNICTVLECPDLSIPWFHQNIPNFRECHFHAKYSEWNDIAKQCLMKVFGGPEYVKCRNVSSPYHYNIDMECYLTNEGVPVAYRNMDKVKDSMDVRRLAVIILQPHHVCSNSPHLLGTTEMKIRHLEILGYEVVTLFYKDLESLKTEEEKCSYFKKKLSLAQ